MANHKQISIWLILVIGGALLALGITACANSGSADTAITPQGDTAAADNNLAGTIPVVVGIDVEITPLNQGTPAAGTCTYDAALVAELETPNGTEVPPGQPFLKTWQVLNSGTCLWEPGTQMRFVDGNLAGIVESVNLPITEPGQTANVSVGFIAPDRLGSFASFWQLQMRDGTRIETVFTAAVVVTTNPGASPTPISSATPPPTAAPEQPTATPTPAPNPTTAPPAPTLVPSVVPPPIETPAEGWFGEYFNNPNLSGSPLATRIDPEINFDWGTGAPMPLFPSNQFSVRWTRSVSLEEGVYRFYARSDDGVRVWVDNQLIIDEWKPVQNRTFQADIALGTGSHAMRVDYYEAFQLASVQVSWQRQSGFTGWRGEYFPNQFLNGSPVLVRDDPAVAFNWGTGSPAANLPPDHFSARWTQTVALRAATYEFNALVDDGIRVWVDNVLVIDDWQSGNLRQVQGQITVGAGDHFIRVEYFEDILDAAVWVWWDTGGSFPDWRGEYWANSTFTGPPDVVRNDPTIDFRWGFESPAPGIPPDRFSVRWARLDDYNAGTYRITARADGPIRVYVSGQLVIDRWFVGDPRQELVASIPLSGTQSVVVLYRQESGAAEVNVEISPGP